jgi:predicted secreted protein
VTLADLPGAGYVWTAEEIPAGLELVETTASAPEPDLVGAPTEQMMRFRADRAGEYVLVFTFARPWENSPAEKRTVRVRVRPQDPEEESR